MNKTPIGELIKWMDDNKGHCTYGTIRQEAEKLLEKEKQMVIDAHTSGQELIIKTVIDTLEIDLTKAELEIKKAKEGDNDECAVDYFNQTYNQ